MPQIAGGSEERLDETMLRVTRVSSFTGATHVIDLPITERQWDAWVHGGALIQNAMPGLSADQREFLMTGSTQEEWDAVFGKDE